MLSDEDHNRDLPGARAHRLGAAVDRRAGWPGRTPPSTPRSGVAAARAGPSCPARPWSATSGPAREPAPHRRQEVRPLPGARTHGHRRSHASAHARVGWDYVHSIVDDCSRLAYSRGPRRRARRDRHRLHPQGARLAARPRHRGRAHPHTTTPGPTPTTARSASSCSGARSSTGRSRPTGPKQTARSSATSKRWHANGPTARPTPTQTPAAPRCHTGSSTTTSAGTTARSETGHRSRWFTRSSGRTARASKAVCFNTSSPCRR